MDTISFNTNTIHHSHYPLDTLWQEHNKEGIFVLGGSTYDSYYHPAHYLSYLVFQ